MTMFQISILKIKAIEGKKQLRAFADVSINSELTINGIRLMDDGKGYWLGLPQTTYESSGKTRYAPIVEASEELKKQLRDEIVKHLIRTNKILGELGRSLPQEGQTTVWSASPTVKA
jgi:DNA-binding cell septation regulator SpoVG